MCSKGGGGLESDKNKNKKHKIYKHRPGSAWFLRQIVRRWKLFKTTFYWDHTLSKSELAEEKHPPARRRPKIQFSRDRQNGVKRIRPCTVSARAFFNSACLTPPFSGALFSSIFDVKLCIWKEWVERWKLKWRSKEVLILWNVFKKSLFTRKGSVCYKDQCLFLSIKSVVFFEQVKKSLFSCDLFFNLDGFQYKTVFWRDNSIRRRESEKGMETDIRCFQSNELFPTKCVSYSLFFYNKHYSSMTLSIFLHSFTILHFITSRTSHFKSDKSRQRG